MRKTIEKISVSVARIRLGELIRQVAKTEEPVIITIREGAESEIQCMLVPVVEDN